MRIVIVLLATSFALTACGRRGALQPPPSAAAVEQPGAASGTDTGMVAEKPDPSFILDPLI